MSLYLWLKAFHIIAMVCWMAGIFYLPRLFIYHTGTTDKAGRERFCTMESKLMGVIMNPSMAVTVLLGIWLIVETWPAYATSGWLWTKVFLVVLLIGYHHFCQRLIRQFAQDSVQYSERFLRIFNEIPVLLLFGIVLLVVLKPF